MGGGGFTMGERSPALDRLVLELTGRPVPRICFMPTASGDAREQVIRFHERFGLWPCEPSTLSLFHLGRDRVDPAEHLLTQDAIYVGGGSMRNMLAIWREHGIEEIMRLAWQAGIVLAGLSAGAMCWFEGGISLSGGAPEVVEGIGLLPGSLSVHMTGEPERLPAYRRAVREDRLPGGVALDDGAALLFAGPALREGVASRAQARALRVESSGGNVAMSPLPLRLLPGAEPVITVPRSAPGPSEDEAAIAELRAIRAARRRWEYQS